MSLFYANLNHHCGFLCNLVHHCAEGHETEGTLLKSSAYINDVESAKLWMAWGFVL